MKSGLGQTIRSEAERKIKAALSQALLELAGVSQPSGEGEAISDGPGPRGAFCSGKNQHVIEL